jgi:ABC-type nitrate/sulfonate/bicarbonate transport system substrate-binding protein
MTVEATLGKADLAARSDAQLAHRLEQQFDAIWRLGDRDECSIKHIGHAMAALIVTGDWRKAIDYDAPWGSLGNSDYFDANPEQAQRFADYFEDAYGWSPETMRQKHRELFEKWDKVIDTVARIDNIERVETRIMPLVKHSFYVLAYLEDYRGELEARA